MAGRGWPLEPLRPLYPWLDQRGSLKRDSGDPNVAQGTRQGGPPEKPRVVLYFAGLAQEREEEGGMKKVRALRDGAALG
jgi:hypothetical protein